ncbi:MAG: choloylglycine hydrolase [Clostridia bacterium]|nr:choloylglycine hydrolase [Clostridia bacterium]
MCTAVTFRNGDHYFGRTLDYECSFGESVVITPRNYPFSFRKMGEMPRHLAMIGMAHMADGIPLYYEATNEAGLSIAALNFPDFARYHPEGEGIDNIAPFEIIPWVLGQCKTLQEAKVLFGRMRVLDLPYSDTLPLTPLHWMAADASGAIAVESGEGGLRIFENPVGVLTNSPPFDSQMRNLANYMTLSRKPPKNHLAPEISLPAHSRGMGALGLPGDLSSPGRFVRCAYTKLNARSDGSEMGNVSQFFHILGSVAHARGTVELGEGEFEITIYTSCCNTDRGIYYYTTYENRQISAVQLHNVDLEGDRPIAYALVKEQQIRHQN